MKESSRLVLPRTSFFHCYIFRKISLKAKTLALLHGFMGLKHERVTEIRVSEYLHLAAEK
jgi:hypothetical protein